MINITNYDVIVSLTSWENRFNDLIENLISLVNQKTKFKYKICLTLTKNELSNLNEKIKIYIKQNNIEIITADINLKSHKKYFYAMQLYRIIPIITVDDDVIYNSSLIENLMNDYTVDKTAIIASRIHEITFNNNHINSYKKWKINRYSQTASHKFFATGVGGILYPPNCLHISNNDLTDIKLYETNDDFFLKDRALKFDIKIKHSQSKNKMYIPLKSANNDTSLYLINVQNKSLNDEYIKILESKYFSKIK